MSKLRAFLALNLPIEMIEAIAAVQQQLKQRTRQLKMKVAWVPPPNMHVTLKFLGDVPEDSVMAIRDRLGALLEQWGAIALDVGGVGVFPSLQKPRVLWVGVESAADALGRLFAAVDTDLEQLGFERESRPFHGHLTLGRVKHGAELGEMLSDLERASFGQCSVHEVVLYKSVLQRTGAEYTALGRFPLSARRTVEENEPPTAGPKKKDDKDGR